MGEPFVQRSLKRFSGSGYDPGRGWLWKACWVAASKLLVEPVVIPARIRVLVLRVFGASIGNGVLIRERVRVHWPWKLTIGDDSWIGAGAWLLNLEPIKIGRDTCVSQEVLLCTGSHDRKSPSFEFDNAPISIGDSCWIATRAVVLRGVCIGNGVTVGAGALVTSDVSGGAVVLPSRSIVHDNVVGVPAD